MGAALGVVLCSGVLISINLFPTEIDQWFREQSELEESYLKLFVSPERLWVEDGGRLATGLVVAGLLYAIQKLVLATILVVAVFQVCQQHSNQIFDAECLNGATGCRVAFVLCGCGWSTPSWSCPSPSSSTWGC